MSMNLKTGTFKALFEGIYYFSFSGVKDKSIKKIVWIVLRLNEYPLDLAFGSQYASFSAFSLQSILHLKKGDKVDLYLHYGAIYDTADHLTHFSGILLTSNVMELQNKDDDQPSTSVYFYVQRRSPYSVLKTTIPYESENINYGKAMNIASGFFTATIDGIYHFAFSGIKDDSLDSLWINIRLNGRNIGAAHGSENIPHAAYSLHSTLKLRKGDKVDIFLREGVLYGFQLFNSARFIGFLFKKPINNQSPVHFYVQRNSSYSSVHSSIPFQLSRLNEGLAMNLETGVFVAPRDGTYHFSLSGIKDNSDDPLLIHLRLNEKNIGAAYGSLPFATFFLHSTLRMEKGDQVDLYLSTGTCYDTKDHLTHFTGSLIGYFFEN